MRLRAGQDRLGQRGRADGRPGDRHRPRRRRQRARSWCAATPPTATARWSRACRRGGAQFSLVMTKNPRRRPRHRRHRRDTPGPRCATRARCRDPDTGAWISDAEVAEIPYTAFASTNDRITARLIVRRVKDARYPDALFPVWRYHPFFTNTDLPAAARRHHPPPPRDHRNRVRRPDRRTPGPHARRGASAPTPPGCCAPRSPTTCCAPPAPSPATATRRARGATLRRQHHQRPGPAGPPATPTRPAPTQPLALGAGTGLHCGTTPSATAHPLTADSLTTRRQGPTGAHRKSWTDQRPLSRPPPGQSRSKPQHHHQGPSVDSG